MARYAGKQFANIVDNYANLVQRRNVHCNESKMFVNLKVFHVKDYLICNLSCDI